MQTGRVNLQQNNIQDKTVSKSVHRQWDGAGSSTITNIAQAKTTARQQRIKSEKTVKDYTQERQTK